MTYTATAPQDLGTCSTCPYFASRHDGSTKGWCHLFDQFARSTHCTTQDCVNVGGLDEQDSDIDQVFQDKEAEALSAQAEAAEAMIAPALVAKEVRETDTVYYLHDASVLVVSPNVYMVPSETEAGDKYRVDLYHRKCTCKAGSYGRGCKHIKKAEAQAEADFKEWQDAAKKVPAGWVQKGGWWYNHHGHRTNKPPVSLSPRELAALSR